MESNLGRCKILFYEMPEAFVEKYEKLVHLRQIIGEEYNHIARLKHFFRSMIKVRLNENQR
ncbi:MAG: hypothetical protein K9L30_01765 [Desulfobacterales bacterium]|nr:hypothetical protein [Desulfobacterales bacterium]